MYSTQKSLTASPGFPLLNGLGRESSNCRWIWMGEQLGYRWVCFKGLDGLGAAARACPAGDQKCIDATVNTGLDDTQIVPPPGTNGSFDIMKFVTDNWMWLAIGAAGLILIPMLIKKRR